MEHLILGKFNSEGKLTQIQYFKTAFSREIGDQLNYEGTKMEVIKSCVSKIEALQIIQAISIIWKKQSSALARQRRKREAREFNIFLANIINDASADLGLSQEDAAGVFNSLKIK